MSFGVGIKHIPLDVQCVIHYLIDGDDRRQSLNSSIRWISSSLKSIGCILDSDSLSLLFVIGVHPESLVMIERSLMITNDDIDIEL